MDEVDMAIRQFQGMTHAIKFRRSRGECAVWAGFGGGCEVSLHTAARQPHAELYMGLVEVGVVSFPAAAAAKRCCCAPSIARLRFAPTAAASQSNSWKR